MDTTTAHDLAKYIILVMRQRGTPVTNLKLQKLLYYAQAWFLALNAKPLFAERIEAWVNGPVVPPVFGEYKHNKSRPIEDVLSLPELSKEMADHVEMVLNAYGHFTPFELVNLSHGEAPWLDARKGIAPDAPANVVIGLDSMEAYFSRFAGDA